MITCQTQPAEAQKELKTAALYREKILPSLTKRKMDGWEKTTAIFQLSSCKSLGPEETLDYYWKNESCEVGKYAKNYIEFQSKQKSKFYKMETE